jgi:hypothetical protein
MPPAPIRQGTTVRRYSRAKHLWTTRESDRPRHQVRDQGRQVTQVSAPECVNIGLGGATQSHSTDGNIRYKHAQVAQVYSSNNIYIAGGSNAAASVSDSVVIGILLTGI